MADIRESAAMQSNHLIKLIDENRLRVFKNDFMLLHAYEQATFFAT